MAFFGFIKLWLLYMTSSGSRRRKTDSFIENADAVNIIPDVLSGGGGALPDSLPFGGGGGQFQGGGASAFFDQATPSVGEALPD